MDMVDEGRGMGRNAVEATAVSDCTLAPMFRAGVNGLGSFSPSRRQPRILVSTPLCGSDLKQNECRASNMVIWIGIHC